MREDKKKGNGLVVVIILLILVIVGLALYICYDKGIVFKKEVSDKTVKEEKKKKAEENTITNLTDADVSSIISQLDVYNSYFSGNYPINNVSELSNQSILEFASRNVTMTNSSFTSSDVDKVVKKYFGNDFKYTNEDINCFVGDGVLYRYDSATGKYAFATDVNHGHGGGGSYRTKTYFQDGTYDKNNDIYTLNVKVLYGPNAGDTYGPVDSFYSNAKDAMEYKNELYKINVDDISGDDSGYYDEAYKNVKDKLPITTYTLKKDGSGNYGLVSIVIKN